MSSEGIHELAPIYQVYDEDGKCNYCSNTWGLHSGRKDICPMCEKNYHKKKEKGKMIKRYKTTIAEHNPGGRYVNPINCDDGEWVKYEDIKPILDNYHKLLNNMVIDDSGIHFTPYEWPEMIKPDKPWPKPEEKKGNCAERLETIQIMTDQYEKEKGQPIHTKLVFNKPDQWWICPVHGYKRR